MSGILLVTRPKHDDTTHYLFHWAEEIIKIARKKGIKVLDLNTNRARKKELESVVAKMRPSFIFFNGHGDVDRIAGQDGEILVVVGDNTILKSSTIYALSCGSAKCLGPDCVSNGVRAYLGYDDVFMFFYDIDKISKPLEDKTAELFLRPSNRLMESFLKGHTTEESYNRSQELFFKNIQKLVSSRESGNSYIIPYLLWDKNHQVYLGDKNATL